MTEFLGVSWLFEQWSKLVALRTIVCLSGLILVVTTVALNSQDFAGGGIGIREVPKDYNGPCPVVVQFRATIFHGISNIKVRYHWKRDDGKSTPRHSGELADGKLDVSDEFSIGVPGHPFAATDSLHVLFEGARKEVVSPRIEAKGTCVQ